MKEKSVKLSPIYIISICSILAASSFYYGIRVIILLAVTMFAALCTDYFCTRLQKKKYKASNLDCLAETALLVFMLPASFNFAYAAIAAVFMVIIGRYVLGSGSKRIIPAPAVGYIFALVFWKRNLLSFPENTNQNFWSLKLGNLVSSSSSYFNLNEDYKENFFDVLIGNVTGALGTNIIILLVFIGFILIAFKKINLTPALGMLLIMFVFGTLTSKLVNTFRTGIFEIFSNFLMFAAVFLISDKETSPSTFWAGLIYGVTVGFLTFYFTFFTHMENSVIASIIICSPVCYLCKKMNVVSKIKVKKKGGEALNED